MKITVVALTIFLVSCSVFSNKQDYPEWEEWQSTPKTISIEIEASEEALKSNLLNYRVTLTNNSDEVLEIGASNSLDPKRGLEFDLAVINSNDELVWTRFPRGSVYQSILYTVQLEPGERYTMDGSWDLRDRNGKRIPAGSYTLYAGLHGLEISVMKGEPRKVVESTNYGEKPIGSDPFGILVN